jgi:hypothetical protein
VYVPAGNAAVPDGSSSGPAASDAEGAGLGATDAVGAAGGWLADVAGEPGTDGDVVDAHPATMRARTVRPTARVARIGTPYGTGCIGVMPRPGLRAVVASI